MLRCVGHCRLIKPGCHVDDPRDELLGSFRHSSISISHLISTLVDPTGVGRAGDERIDSHVAMGCDAPRSTEMY